MYSVIILRVRSFIFNYFENRKTWKSCTGYQMCISFVSIQLLLDTFFRFDEYLTSYAPYVGRPIFI
jgi:hypothetical protein